MILFLDDAKDLERSRSDRGIQELLGSVKFEMTAHDLERSGKTWAPSGYRSTSGRVWLSQIKALGLILTKNGPNPFQMCRILSFQVEAFKLGKFRGSIEISSGSFQMRDLTPI